MRKKKEEVTIGWVDHELAMNVGLLEWEHSRWNTASDIVGLLTEETN